MSDVEVRCPGCERTYTFDERVPFRAECDACSDDLHVCIACRFYDRYVENECRETEADPIAVKDRSNLCEYFKPRAAPGTEDDDAARAKAKLAALFGDKGAKGAASAADDPQAAARARLDALFKKD